MRRAFGVAVVVVLLALQPVAASASRLGTAQFDRGLLALTNDARAKNNRAALKAGACFDRYAQRQAQRMAARRAMYHQNLRVVLRACKARSVAENVAEGFGSPGPNVTAWLRSPGHRKNLLNAKYTRLGIGVAYDRRGRAYTVQVFGRPR